MSEPPASRRRGRTRTAAGPAAWQPDLAELQEVVRSLEVIDRPSASDGERAAADRIAGRLREIGCSVMVERESAHGTYWWPIGLLSAASAVAGLLALRGRRVVGAVVGALAGASMVDELDSGPHLFRHLALPYHATWNVIAEAGDPEADQTLVVAAHHDAAHTGLVFNPGPQRAVANRFPGLIERGKTQPPLWFPVLAGPVLVAIGSLLGLRAITRLGVFLGLGSAVALTDIGRSRVVPGANDNLSAVAVLVALARSLQENPIKGLRVLLLSAGSEESIQEGMLAFGRHHFHELPTDKTRFVMLDTVGSPRLVMLEAEGTLAMRRYDRELSELIATSAAELGVELVSGMRARTSTDGVVPNKAGYPTAVLVSFDKNKQLSNYHLPTDIADNLDFGTVANCARVMNAVVRKLAG